MDFCKNVGDTFRCKGIISQYPCRIHARIHKKTNDLRKGVPGRALERLVRKAAIFFASSAGLILLLPPSDRAREHAKARVTQTPRGQPLFYPHPIRARAPFFSSVDSHSISGMGRRRGLKGNPTRGAENGLRWGVTNFAVRVFSSNLKWFRKQKSKQHKGVSTSQKNQ